MQYIAIELTTPEQYEIRGDLFPSITHARVANFSIEVPRPDDEKIGHVDIWLEKGYMNGVEFQLAPGYPGVELRIDEPELWYFVGSPIAAGAIGIELMRVVHQVVVDQGVIIGTVVLLGEA